MAPTMSGIRGLDVKHVIGAAVAASVVALALAQGGFEPTAFAAAGLVVWIALVVGLAVGALPRSQPPTAALVAGIALAAFAALTALSLAWASDDGNGFEDVVRTLAYLGAFAAVVLASRRAEATSWLAGLAVGGRRDRRDRAARPVRAVPVRQSRRRPRPPAGGARPAHLPDRLLERARRGDGGGDRAAELVRRVRRLAAPALAPSPRSPAVVLALWMTDSRGGLVAAVIAFASSSSVGPRRSRLLANLALGLAFGAVADRGRREPRQLLNDPIARRRPVRAIGCSSSRCVVVGSSSPPAYVLDRLRAAVCGLAPDRVVGLRYRRVVAVVGIVAIDPIQQFDEFKAPPTATASSGDVGLLRGGGSGRYQFWETAVDAFAGAPVGGVGASGYTPYWFEHREIPIPATRAHSVLFETLAELGIVGLGLLLAFFGAAAVSLDSPARAAGRSPRSARRWRCWSSGSPPRRPTGPGTCRPCSRSRSSPRRCSPGRRPCPAPTRAHPRASRATARRRRGFASGVALLLVAWISICGSGLLLLSAHSLDASRSDAADGDVEAALGRQRRDRPAAVVGRATNPAGTRLRAGRRLRSGPLCDGRGDPAVARRLSPAPARGSDGGRGRGSARRAAGVARRASAQPARPVDRPAARVDGSAVSSSS